MIQCHTGRLPKDSKAEAEQIGTPDKTRLVRRTGESEPMEARATTRLYLLDDHCFEADAIVVAVRENSVALLRMISGIIIRYFFSFEILPTLN